MKQIAGGVLETAITTELSGKRLYQQKKITLADHESFDETANKILSTTYNNIICILYSYLQDYVYGNV